MTRHAWLDPSPFSFPSGPVGVLLIHGFTGAPTEMRPLGEFLSQRGYSVLAPLLPGHGATPTDLNAVGWPAWIEAVDAAWHDLAARTKQVFVGGLSMGGLLALNLAAQETRLRGVILFAPALRVFNQWQLPLAGLIRRARPLMPKAAADDADLGDPEAVNRIWSYESWPMGGIGQFWRLQRHVGRQLARVTQPLLLFQGRRDSTVQPSCPALILDRVSSTDKQLIWLPDSGHNLLVDAEKEQVFQASLDWIEARL